MTAERRITAVQKGVPFIEGQDSINLESSESIGLATSSTIIFTNPGFSPGRVLVVHVTQDQNGTWSAPAGWTQIYGPPPTVTAVCWGIFYRVTGASETGTYVFTSTRSDQCTGVLMEFSGVDTSNPIHKLSDIYEQKFNIAPFENYSILYSVSNTITNVAAIGFGSGDPSFGDYLWDPAPNPVGWDTVHYIGVTGTGQTTQITSWTKIVDAGDSGDFHIEIHEGSFRERSERMAIMVTLTPITGTSFFNADDLNQAQNTTDVFISVSDDAILNARALDQNQILDSTTIVEQQTLSPDALDQVQNLGNTAFLDATFTVADLNQTQSLDQSILSLRDIFNMNSLDQSQTLDSTTILVDLIFPIQSLNQKQKFDEADIGTSLKIYTLATESSGATSLLIPVSEDVRDGEGMIAVLETEGSENHTAPGGWTAIFEDNTTGKNTLSIWKRSANSEPSNYTFTWGSSQKAIGAILILTQVDDLNPIYDFSVTQGHSNAAISPAADTFQDGDLSIIINSHDQKGGQFITVTTPANYRIAFNEQLGPQAGIGLQIARRNIETAGTVAAQQWDLSRSIDWIAAHLTAKPYIRIQPSDLNQIQSLGETNTALIADNLSQSQSMESPLFASSADDYQIFTDSLSHSQSMGVPFFVELDPFISDVVMLVSWDGNDGDTTAIDESLNGYTLTFQNNAELSNAQSVLGYSTSLACLGDVDRVGGPANSDMTPGGGQYCAESLFIFNAFAAATEEQDIISRWSSFSARRCFIITYNPNTGLLRFIYNDGSTTYEVSGSWSPSLGGWYHVAVDIDASGDIRLWVGPVGGTGTLIAGPTARMASINNSVEAIRFGGRNDISVPEKYDLLGWMQETRLTIHSRYASAFVPAAGKFPRPLRLQPNDLNQSQTLESSSVYSGVDDYGINTVDINQSQAIETPAITEVVLPSFAASSDMDTNGTNFSIAKPSGTVQNDILLLHIISDENPTITWPSGFASNILFEEQDTTTGTQLTHGLAWKLAGASEPANYSFNTSTSQVVSASMVRVSNADTSTPIDNFDRSIANGNRTISLTPNTDGVLIIGFGGADKNIASNMTPPSEQTTVYDHANGGTAGVFHTLGWETQGVASLISRIFSTNGGVNEQCAGALVSIKRA